MCHYPDGHCDDCGEPRRVSGSCPNCSELERVREEQEREGVA